jgi:hypothetical protein
MSEQQIPQVSRLMGQLVSHQAEFARMRRMDRQWAIQHPKEAINTFIGAIERRAIQGEIVIDCSACPVIPEGYVLLSHEPQGKQLWDPARIELWYCEEQQPGSHVRIKGAVIEQSLPTDRPALNANVAWFLAQHQQSLPRPVSWGPVYVMFWGTKYVKLDQPDRTFIPQISWTPIGGCRLQLHEVETWDFFSNHPAALWRLD